MRRIYRPPDATRKLASVRGLAGTQSLDTQQDTTAAERTERARMREAVAGTLKASLEAGVGALTELQAAHRRKLAQTMQAITQAHERQLRHEKAFVKGDEAFANGGAGDGGGAGAGAGSLASELARAAEESLAERDNETLALLERFVSQTMVAHVLPFTAGHAAEAVRRAEQRSFKNSEEQKSNMRICSARQREATADAAETVQGRLDAALATNGELVPALLALEEKYAHQLVQVRP